MAETSVQALLGSIYSGHRQGLFSLALTITRNRHQAEDAVHEAFVRLCRRPHMADEPLAYVYRAVRNAAIDQTRKRARIETPEPIFAETAADRRPGAEGDYLAAERNTVVQEALESLAEPQRQVVVMKVYAGLTFDQIARVLGEPLSTVSSRYRRALEKLKDSVAQMLL